MHKLSHFSALTLTGTALALALTGAALAGGGAPAPTPAEPAPVQTAPVSPAPGQPTPTTPTTGGGYVPSPYVAKATLLNAEGQIRGSVRFSQVEGGTRVQVLASGLTPGQAGMHVHANGACEASRNEQTGEVTPFGAAGGHFDPAGTGNHATPTTSSLLGHAGDLPMLTVGEDGRAEADFVTQKISVNGFFGVMGKSVVVHAMSDDYATDPAGNAGARVSCGVVTR